jgi:glycosyltransferase involved in cell wall biosynthesis
MLKDLLFREYMISKEDVLHLHSSKAGILGRLLVFSKRINNSVYYTPNGASFIRKDISTAKRWIYRFAEYSASKLGGILIAVSKSESETFAKIGVSSTHYINNGTDVSSINIKEKKEKKIKVVTSGRVTPQKDPELFQQIANHFVSLNTDVQFIWIGDGEKTNVLQSSNIKVTGWVEKSEIQDILENCDIYLSTAKWEGLPFAVLEAMNCCLPLVLRNCIGNVDLVEENENGYLWNSVDEAVNFLEALIETKHLRKRMGQKSRSKLKNEFNTVDMILHYEDVYLNGLET